MWLLPREHGAYGQMSFPLLTAFIVAGPSAAGLLLAAAVTPGFLGHESAAVLLGLRGARAKREQRSSALRWLAGCLSVGTAAGTAAALLLAPYARWSLLVPVVPALLLLAATVRQNEKSWTAQVAAALAFSSAAVPVSMAAGAPLETGLAVAIPFALLFVASTLAVRVVILRVRGGGDPRAAAATRRAVLALVVAAAAALGALTAASVLPLAVLVAATPGLLAAAVIALRPPAPARLRTVGWTLVAVSIVTGALVVAGNA
jgi:hypothetical protein